MPDPCGARDVCCNGHSYRHHARAPVANMPLSQFTVVYQPDRKHFRRVADPHHFEIQYQSPQLELWGRSEVEWHLVRRVPEYAARLQCGVSLPPLSPLIQPPLFPIGA